MEDDADPVIPDPQHRVRVRVTHHVLARKWLLMLFHPLSLVKKWQPNLNHPLKPLQKEQIQGEGPY